MLRCRLLVGGASLSAGMPPAAAVSVIGKHLRWRPAKVRRAFHRSIHRMPWHGSRRLVEVCCPDHDANRSPHRSNPPTVAIIHVLRCPSLPRRHTIFFGWRCGWRCACHDVDVVDNSCCLSRHVYPYYFFRLTSMPRYEYADRLMVARGVLPHARRGATPYYAAGLPRLSPFAAGRQVFSAPPCRCMQCSPARLTTRLPSSLSQVFRRRPGR